jgi:hypothetical protein
MSESKNGVSIISYEESFAVVSTYFGKSKSSVSVICYEESFIVNTFRTGGILVYVWILKRGGPVTY